MAQAKMLIIFCAPVSLDSGGGGRRAPRKVDVRLPGKGNANSDGARPVHLIITWEEGTICRSRLLVD
jgi:hypothetical protein